MMTDPIADMLTRIRNAVRVESPHVDLPLSKVNRGLAEVLKRNGVPEPDGLKSNVQPEE